MSTMKIGIIGSHGRSSQPQPVSSNSEPKHRLHKSSFLSPTCNQKWDMGVPYVTGLQLKHNSITKHRHVLTNHKLDKSNSLLQNISIYKHRSPNPK